MTAIAAIPLRMTRRKSAYDKGKSRLSNMASSRLIQMHTSAWKRGPQSCVASVPRLPTPPYPDFQWANPPRTGPQTPPKTRPSPGKRATFIDSGPMSEVATNKSKQIPWLCLLYLISFLDRTSTFLHPIHWSVLTIGQILGTLGSMALKRASISLAANTMHACPSSSSLTPSLNL